MSYITAKKPKHCPHCHGRNIINDLSDGWVCEDCGTQISQEDTIFSQAMSPNEFEIKKRRGRSLFNILFGTKQEEE